MKRAICALAFIWGVLFALSGLAAAVVERANGEVKAGLSATAATAVSVGQNIPAGSTIVTGPKGFVALRFDDGQAVLLNENSEFRVREYSFSRDEPAKDRFVFELFKGAMRSVTALLTRRRPTAYELHLPQATVGIRGTDFMAALVNPAFVSVLSGTIGVSNSAGVATFAAGSTGTVASATTLPASIAPSALPASVSTSFSQLSAVTVSVGAGAGEAAGAAAGGVTPAMVGIVGAIAAGLAAASSSGNGTPGTTGTTGTTGTR